MRSGLERGSPAYTLRTDLRSDVISSALRFSNLLDGGLGGDYDGGLGESSASVVGGGWDRALGDSL